MRTHFLLLASLAPASLMAQPETTTVAPAAPVEAVAPATTAPTPAVTAPTSVSQVMAAPTITATTAAPVATPSSKAKDTLSVDFPDEEIRTILRNVADLFELNLVIPDTLQGRTSLKLREVTWRQIFQVVLAPVGYSFIEDGNIIKIVSQDTLQAEPFITDTIVLENVSVSSIQPLLIPILTPAKPGTATTAPVVGGTLTPNTLSNELIVTDQLATVRKVVEMARRLDAEPKQVAIETKFVEISKTDGETFAFGASGQGTKNGTFGAVNTFNTPFPGVIPNTGTVNAVLNARDFSLMLSALETYKGTRLVSSPTIVAINGTKSEIKIGLDKQLITATQNTASSGANITTTYTAGGIQFAGVKIGVTPQITSSKLVSLKLKTEKSELVPSFTDPNSGQVFYDVNIREGDLSVILRDGQTAAIGGLMDTNDTKNSTRVPIVSKIPLIGFLFRTKNDSVVARNLIVFITANIVEPSKMTYSKMTTRDQLDELKITERDIQGVNYKNTDKENALYDAAMEARKARQDAEIEAKLEKDAKKDAKKK